MKAVAGVSSALAAYILEKRLREGATIEIPSLGITLGGSAVTTEDIEREGIESDALDEARKAYPHVAIRRAAAGGCCDDCGAEETIIYDTEQDWKCSACLHDFAEQEPANE